MRRLHLIEIHDQCWCPRSLRDALTRFLAFFIYWVRPYLPVADVLSPFLRRTRQHRIIDLCSGGGGPWPFLIERVRDRLGDDDGVTVSLTDKYPTQCMRQLPDGVSFVEDSLDAMSMPPERAGFRTLFTSFHHFGPDGATAILRDAVRNQTGIAVFEFTRRNPWTILSFLAAPFLVWVAVPFLRPFRWRDWLWTYPIPILPAVVLFDGIVSCLRTYSPQECLVMAEEADPEGTFDWHAGVKTAMPGGMTYLVGVPVERAA